MLGFFIKIKQEEIIIPTIVNKNTVNDLWGLILLLGITTGLITVNIGVYF